MPTYMAGTSTRANPGVPIADEVVDAYDGFQLRSIDGAEQPAPLSVESAPPPSLPALEPPTEPEPDQESASPTPPPATRIDTRALLEFIEREKPNLVGPARCDSDASYDTVEGDVTQYYYSDIE
jgi:hypothetical protein